MSDFIEEGMARRESVAILRRMLPLADNALRRLYLHSPGYAGEVEAVKEAVNNAINILQGGAPE